MALVDNWNYWFRWRGMRTSTDDIIVAYCATRKAVQNVYENYVDLGCGIGSTLLIIARNLEPHLSTGVEAQRISSALAMRTVAELPVNVPKIDILNMDIRDMISTHTLRSDNKEVPMSRFWFACDLITANPPYLPPASGTYCKDQQKMHAHFELRGGVEDYCHVASRLLAPNGRFFLSFWCKNNGDLRVTRAVEMAGLVIIEKTQIYLGKVTLESTPFPAPPASPTLIVYEIVRQDMDSCHGSDIRQTSVINELDLRVPPNSSSGHSDAYIGIRKALKLAPAPRR